jgi:hypothetical protein
MPKFMGNVLSSKHKNNVLVSLVKRGLLLSKLIPKGTRIPILRGPLKGAKIFIMNPARMKFVNNREQIEPENSFGANS